MRMTEWKDPNGQPVEMLTHRAHDWRQELPLTASRLRCMTCGVETRIGEWDVPRCRLQWARVGSGFLEED